MYGAHNTVPSKVCLASPSLFCKGDNTFKSQQIWSLISNKMTENVKISLVHFFSSLALIEHLLHAQQCGDCLLEQGSIGYSVA